MGEPLRRVLGGQAAVAGEAAGDRLQADVGDAGEEAGAAARDGEVGDVADVAVEDGAARAARPARRRSAAARRRRPGRGSSRRPRGRRRPARGRRGAAARGRRRPCRGGRRRRSRRPAAAQPSSAGTPPTTWCSSTAWSSGIGICSWAWKRTAASISFGSSIAGSRRVRTTTRWLPIPSRTRFESLCCGEERLQRRRRGASGSSTSPSWKAPGVERRDRGAAHAATAPFSCTSAAAMLPASMSRPTTLLVFCLPMRMREPDGHRRPAFLIDRKARRPFALQLLIPRKTWQRTSA